MIKQPLSARVSSNVLSDAKARAELESVSLSAIVEAALKEYLRSAPDAIGGESPLDEKPEWAIALESRVSQLEAQGSVPQRGRKGKRRR